MKIKFLVLALMMCFLLTGCINVEITVPGSNKSNDMTTQPTEATTPEILDYPDTIGTEKEKLLTPILPDEVFGSTAEENGLEGTLYKIYGTVTSITADLNGEPDTIHLRTYKGNVIICNPAVTMKEDGSFNEIGTVDWDKVNNLCPMPEVGELCCIFAEYQGYSEKYKAPYFSYGSADFLLEILFDAMKTQ